MACDRTGLPTPRYQWRYGNADIPDQTSNILTLPIISPDQEGEYQCIVSQYDGVEEHIDSKLSECVPVFIKPTCIEIITHPASSYNEDRQELGTYLHRHRPPKCAISMVKDNKKLDKQDSSEVQMGPFHGEDKGKYYCIASNGFGNKHSKASELNVTLDKKQELKLLC